MKRNTEKVSAALKEGCVGKGHSGQLSSRVCYWDVCIASPLLPWIALWAETLKMVMALERWLWEEGNKRNCLPNWGFWITSSLVITLEIYGVHFFLCKLIYKYWSGLPGCFLRKYVNYYCLYPGNLLTILNTMKKPTLFHLITCKRS